MRAVVLEAETSGGIDRLARLIGWFSLALGAMELLRARKVARTIGFADRQDRVRRDGAREAVAGIQMPPAGGTAGLRGRVLGDLVEIATLLPALRTPDPQRARAMVALAAIAGVTLLDVLAWRAATQSRQPR